MQTMTPIWVKATTGSTPSTAKTAAIRMPALVMTAPVDDRARTMPSCVPKRMLSSRARVVRKML